MQSTLPSVETLKEQAHTLREKDPKIKNHTTALNVIATRYGYKNWATLLPNIPNKPSFKIIFGKETVMSISMQEAMEEMEEGRELRSKILSLIERKGVIKREEKDEEAEELYKEMVKYERSIRNIALFAFLYNNFADLSLYLTKYKEALTYAKASLMLNQHLNDKEGILSAYHKHLAISLSVADTQSAIKYLNIKRDIDPNNFSYEDEIALDMITKTDTSSLKPLFNMNSHIGYPFKFKVFFGGDEDAKLEEILIRSLSNQMGCGREEAKRYVKQNPNR